MRFRREIYTTFYYTTLFHHKYGMVEICVRLSYVLVKFNLVFLLYNFVFILTLLLPLGLWWIKLLITDLVNSFCEVLHFLGSGKFNYMFVGR